MDLGQLWDAIIKGNAGISDKEFVRRELQRFMNSKERKNILTGRKYYEETMILSRKSEQWPSRIRLLLLANRMRFR